MSFITPVYTSSTSSAGALGTLTAATGLASGLDIDGLVSKLIAADSGVLNNYQNKMNQIGVQISDLGNLVNAITTLGNSAKTFSSLSAATGFQATSSVPADLLASVNTPVTGSTATAQNGNYTINISSLAKAQQQTSTTFSSTTEALGINGEIQFTSGDKNFSISIVAGENDNLVAIANAINSASNNTIVAASVISGNDPVTGVEQDQLVLTAKNPGTDNAVTLTDLNGGTATSAFNFTQTAATDARLTINNLTVIRSTNSISDAIQGVTLNLNAANSTDITLKVAPNSNLQQQQVSSALQSFVTNYNSVIGMVNLYNASDLSTDPTLLQIKNQLAAIVSNFQTTTGTFSTLSQLGISTNTNAAEKSVNGKTYKQTGELIFSTTDFAKAATTDITSIITLLNNTTSGIGKQLSDLVTRFTDKTNGALILGTNSLNDKADSIQNTINVATNRLNKQKETLQYQFSQLESLISRQQAISAQLSSVFDNSENK